MEVRFGIKYDQKGNIVLLVYSNSRTEDPDGKTEIEFLEILSQLGITKEARKNE